MPVFCSGCGRRLSEKNSEDFGYGILCSNCGVSNNVFPDSQIWIELPGGERVGLAFVGEFPKIGLVDLVNTAWTILKKGA